MTEFGKLKPITPEDIARNQDKLDQLKDISKVHAVKLDLAAVTIAMMQAMKDEIERQTDGKASTAVSTRGDMHQLVANVVLQLTAGILTSAYEANAHKNPYYAMGRDAAELVEVCRVACLHALNHVVKEKGGK